MINRRQIRNLHFILPGSSDPAFSRQISPNVLPFRELVPGMPDYAGVLNAG